MNRLECSRERETFSAAKSGSLSEELRQHGRTCASCRDVADLTRALVVLRDDPSQESPLPAPAFLWWKAQLASRRDAVARAVRPVRMAQRAAGLVGSAALVAVGLVEWPAVAAFAARWPASWPREWQSIGFTPGLVAAVMIAGAALIGGVVLAARRILPLED